MAKVVVEMTSDEQRLWRGMNKIISQQAKMEKGFDKTARAGKRAGKQTEGAFSGRALSSLKSYALGLVGVGTALAAMKGGYATWLKNIRETSTATRKAAAELIAFAALQEGGTVAGRVREVSKMAAGYGVTEFGKGWNIVQALQSAYGSYEKGKAGARTVMAAGQAGVPVEMGLEAEMIGAALKQPPGATLRRLYVAGQASSRDPAMMAKASVSLVEFQDQIFGVAVESILAGPYGKKLETYLKAAGIGLAKGKGPFEKTFKKLGVAKGTKLERLEALKAAGIDTTEELLGAGLGEMRQRGAISFLVKNLDKLKEVMGLLRKEAVPGLFAMERGTVEREMPIMGVERHVRMLAAATKEEQALGRPALRAMEQERTERVRALAFRRQGIEQAGPFDVIGEEGRSTWWDEKQFQLMNLFAGIKHMAQAMSAERTSDPLSLMERFQSEKERIGEEFGISGGQSELLEETRKLRVATEEVARNTRGQPTLVAPNEDR